MKSFRMMVRLCARHAHSKLSRRRSTWSCKMMTGATLQNKNSNSALALLNKKIWITEIVGEISESDPSRQIKTRVTCDWRLRTRRSETRWTTTISAIGAISLTRHGLLSTIRPHLKWWLIRHLSHREVPAVDLSIQAWQAFQGLTAQVVSAHLVPQTGQATITGAPSTCKTCAIRRSSSVIKFSRPSACSCATSSRSTSVLSWWSTRSSTWATWPSLRLSTWAWAIKTRFLWQSCRRLWKTWMSTSRVSLTCSSFCQSRRTFMTCSCRVKSLCSRQRVVVSHKTSANNTWCVVGSIMGNLLQALVQTTGRYGVFSKLRMLHNLCSLITQLVLWLWVLRRGTWDLMTSTWMWSSERQLLPVIQIKLPSRGAHTLVYIVIDIIYKGSKRCHT